MALEGYKGSYLWLDSWLLENINHLIYGLFMVYRGYKPSSFWLIFYLACSRLLEDINHLLSGLFKAFRGYKPSSIWLVQGF
jgi:hypothetical protein